MLFDNGNNIRDYIHINDVVEIYKSILNHNYKGITINISTGIGTSTKSIIEIAETFYKRKLKIINVESNDIKISVGSNDLIRKELNYSNFIKLKDLIFKDFFMKLLLVIDNLESGGAQRLLSNLANGLSKIYDTKYFYTIILVTIFNKLIEI